MKPFLPQTLLCSAIVVLMILGVPSFAAQHADPSVPVQFGISKTRHPEPRKASARFYQRASRGEGPCVFSTCTGTDVSARDSSLAGTGGKNVLNTFLAHFDLSAARDADIRLHQNPHDVRALFVRMESAELEDSPELVLDSALRLCALPAGSAVQELASNRVLEHAANTKAFTSVTRRLKAAAALNTACAFNLRLALVAAAMDGQPKIDLDQAARSAGLITRWRIAGPFGNHSNVDFERRWTPELDQLSRQQYATAPPENPKKKVSPAADMSSAIVERFAFRDGMLSLPQYLSAPGIFYAAGQFEVPKGQSSQLELLSPGSCAIFVDGKQVLLQDSRYAAGANRIAALLQLSPGNHRVLVKFTAEAAPLSVAIHPRFDYAKKNALPPAMAQYIETLNAWFRGDLIAMDRQLQSGSSLYPELAQYLRALLYSSAEDHSPRADAAWKALATSRPSALLARIRAAEGAAARGQTDDVRQDVMSILVERPESEAALQMAFDFSRAQTEAPALSAHLLELHPSCTRLAEAVKFLSSTAEQDKARDLEQRLPACAPESLQYARTLAESGRHGAAAAWLQEFIARNPLNRAARRLLIEELVLSNQQSAAALQAGQLHELAPNSRSYGRLAEDPLSAQDSRSPRADGFIPGREFYVPWRRDGLELVRKTAQRSFSGGPAVVLLADKVMEVQRGGAVSVYLHRIVRPLNKDGISRYGEIALPRSADLLELRTIKPSGQVIEPEPAQQKSTISMPALEPGDAIEEEYVLHYADLEQTPAGAASLTFGSFDAPVLFSRLVLLSPPEAKIDVREQAGAPQPLVGAAAESVVRIWERENISQTIAEPYLPSVTLLPTVTVASGDKSRDRLRDQLIEATRPGVHVNEILASLPLPQNASEMEKARQLYHWVTTKIDSTGPDWATSAAEDALQNGQGSRTSTLLALARAAGLRAGLLLARRVDQKCNREGDFSCYTEPLVRFWLAHNEFIDVDAEADDLAFGAVSPALEIREALFIPLTDEDEKRPGFAALSVRVAGEKSVAEGELSLSHGDLVAELDIRLGTARAQEIRGLLRSASARERQAFFEQLALRIFPGAAAVSGSAAHEDDPEQPLEILLHCTVPQFIARQGGAADIDQLVPALGLRSLYAKTAARKFPLFIDSLFFESTTFHLHLPPGVEVRSAPSEFAEKSEFGEYSVRFVQSAQQLDVRREFRIPAQVVPPEKYLAFARFARHIDEAEHQRISLQIGKDLSALH